MKDTKQVLQEAKQFIVERGWCQGKLKNEAGQLCIRGALCEVDNVASYIAAENAIGEAVGFDTRLRSIADWNDAEGRKLQEVLDAFDKAIEACG